MVESHNQLLTFFGRLCLRFPICFLAKSALVRSVAWIRYFSWLRPSLKDDYEDSFFNRETI